MSGQWSFFLSSNRTFSNHLLSSLIDPARSVKVNDISGFIDAAIVGYFLLVIVV